MFKVFEKQCQNCLLSSESIVSPDRRKEIINGCKNDQVHFVCHNSDDNVCCRKFYDKLGHVSQSIRIAERLGVVEFIPQENDEKLMSHKESIKNHKR